MMTTVTAGKQALAVIKFFNSALKPPWHTTTRRDSTCFDASRRNFRRNSTQRHTLHTRRSRKHDICTNNIAIVVYFACYLPRKLKNFASSHGKVGLQHSSSKRDYDHTQYISCYLIVLMFIIRKIITCLSRHRVPLSLSSTCIRK